MSFTTIMHVKRKYGSNAKMLLTYSDSDDVTTKNIYQDILQDID